MLTLIRSQYVTALGRPVWVWADEHCTAGAYCLPVITYTDHPESTTLHRTRTHNTSLAISDDERSPPPSPRSREIALLGLASFRAFL